MDRPSSRIICGDCVEVMRGMPEGSVDSIVCDPPYGLEFMGKDWDRLGDVRQRGDATFDAAADKEPFGRVRHGGSAAYRADRGSARAMQDWHEAWAREALRVLKPGGHLLAFGGTRTYHRLAAGIEDAGFEIRDTIAWMFGSGFPKSLDVSKAIDKAAGVEREVVGEVRKLDSYGPANEVYGGGPDHERVMAVTEPATPEAERWSGWGTALKPAHEPIVVARKPLAGTVAANVLAHGTGALNIDACRIGWGAEGDKSAERKAKGYSDAAKKALGGVVAEDSPTGFSGEVEGSDASGGRWPANVVLGHSPGCVALGTQRVKAATGTVGRGAYGTGTTYGDGKGLRDAPTGEQTGLGDADGMEVVEVWECAEDCPVRLLDAQTGLDRGARGPASGPTFAGPSSSGSMAGDFKGMGDRPAAFHADGGGGASRFFFCPDGGQGRWPANVVLDPEAAAAVDEQTGECRSAGEYVKGGGVQGDKAGAASIPIDGLTSATYADAGGGSRFFYCAKTSTAERNAGLDAQPCRCGKVAGWASAEGPPGATPAASGTSPLRATTAPSTEDDSGSSTTLFGSSPTDPSPAASTSTTVMKTSSTTTSPTSNSSLPPTTSDSTPPTTGGTPRATGSATAASAQYGSSPPQSTGTSTAGAGSSTADVDPATSGSSSKPSSGAGLNCPDCGGVIEGARRNVHPLEPTVKPIELMKWLIRLVTPPGGTVLDPFAGSGTTGCAAALERFAFVGIEREAEYVAIAEARIAWWAEHPDGVDLVKRLERERERAAVAESGQGSLFG